MIWLETTAQEFDLFDAERIFGDTMLVTVVNETSTHSQLGELVSVERIESEHRTLVVFVFKNAGYIMAEGPFAKIVIQTTPSADRHAERMGQLIEELQKPSRAERTLSSWFRWGRD